MEALGEGWLIPALTLALGVFLGLVVPTARWIAGRWRVPLNEALSELKECREELADEKLARMFAEARLEARDRELDNWQSGRWSRE